LRDGLEHSTKYPDVTPAREAIADLHGRRTDEVLVTAGAAEAFELIARWKQWRHAVVVHPQFTEPHAALERAGHQVTVVQCRPEDGYRLDPDAVPAAAGLEVLGHPRRGLLVIRSLTKHWSVPGIRAGYVVGSDRSIAALEARQIPWSVSTPAIAAAIACTSPEATAEAARRAKEIAEWREALVDGLGARGIEVLPSRTSFVLARPGPGVREALRERGVAVRRADTFPGLDATWVRIAVRPPETSARLFAALDALGRD